MQLLAELFHLFFIIWGPFLFVAISRNMFLEISARQKQFLFYKCLYFQYTRQRVYNFASGWSTNSRFLVVSTSGWTACCSSGNWVLDVVCWKKFKIKTMMILLLGQACLIKTVNPQNRRIYQAVLVHHQWAQVLRIPAHHHLSRQQALQLSQTHLVKGRKERKKGRNRRVQKATKNSRNLKKRLKTPKNLICLLSTTKLLGSKLARKENKLSKKQNLGSNRTPKATI